MLEVFNNELELELELVIVPLRGACELDSEMLDEAELDGVEVVLEIWLLDSELTLEATTTLELELKYGLLDGLGLGLGEGVGTRLGEELELDVSVVEN